MAHLHFAKIKDEITHLIKEKNCAPILVRLSWHDAGTYCVNSKNGGPHATMRFSPEKEHGANNGLEIARNLLQPIKDQNPEITLADLWALAGVVAVEVAGGPKVPFRAGRTDFAEEHCPIEGRLPNATKGADHLREIFYRMGLTDRDIVALSGAHTLGRCRPERSGFEGPWTSDPFRFDNSFFVDLFHQKWDQHVNGQGLVQFQCQEKGTMMLATDLALTEDPVFRPIAEGYAKDEQHFFADFSSAFQKLLELGYGDSLVAVQL